MARVSRIRASRLARRQAATMCGLLILTFGLATFGLGAPSAAQPVEQPPDTAAWARCQEAPNRRCVLRRALEVATASWKAASPGREEAFVLIARAQADVGLAQDALATVDLLGPASAEFVPSIVNQIKAAVARTEADAGKLEEAMSTASAITVPVVRGATIGLIAMAEGKAGSIDNALKRVQSVQDATERAIAIRRAAWGLRFIATQRGEDGKIAEALRQSQSISASSYNLGSFIGNRFGYLVATPGMKTPALQIIAEAQIRAGKVVEVVQAVRSSEEFDRALVIAVIMEYLADTGRVSEALRLALVDPLVLDWNVAFTLAITPLSRDLFWRVHSPDDRQPEMRTGPRGKVDPEALAVARSFPAERRAAALRMVAEVLAREGEPARAAEAAQLIDEPRHRIGALIAVGLSQARAGSQAAGQASFGEALQTAQSFQRREHSRVLEQVAAAQARAGMTAEALQTARRSRTVAGVEGYSVEAAVELVHALAEGGHIDEAIRTAGRLGLRESHLPMAAQDYALRLAAISLARAGNGAAALQVAGAIAPNLERVVTLAEMAMVFWEAGADSDAATAIRRAMSAVVSESDANAMIEGLIHLSHALPD